MQLGELIAFLEEKIPPRFAVEWDNVGLLVGDRDQEIRHVLTALDATEEVVDHAARIGADLIVTHHPLLFHPVKSVTEEHFIGRRIRKLIRGGISCYAMHTNFDIAAMADANARQLKLAEPEVLEVLGEDGGDAWGFGRIGNVTQPVTLSEYARFVRKVMCLPAIRVYGDADRIIRRAAVSSGSGKSGIPDAIAKGADTIVTGDVDYHTAIDAVMQGLTVMDAGHYGTEFVFISIVGGMLRERFPELEITEEAVRQPYEVIV